MKLSMSKSTLTFTAALIVVAGFTLVGCGNSSNDTQASPTTQTSASSTVETSTGISPAPDANTNGGDIVIKNVSDCIGGHTYGDHDEQGWFWASCFKTENIDPFTEVTCTIKGFDKQGKVADENTVQAKVGNDQSLMAMGNDVLGRASTTQKIASSIVKVVPSCVLN